MNSIDSSTPDLPPYLLRSPLFCATHIHFLSLEMTTSAMKNSLLPPGLVSNLEQVLLSRKAGGAAAAGEGHQDRQPESNKDDLAEPSSSNSNSNSGGAAGELDSSKPIILVTNADGIESPGLTCLVNALVLQGLYNVHVLAPQSWVFCKASLLLVDVYIYRFL